MVAIRSKLVSNISTTLPHGSLTYTQIAAPPATLTVVPCLLPPFWTILSSQRIRTGICHADVEETATVVFKVDGIRLEIRVDELEHFETDTVPGGHVCQLDFMKSFSVDGEDGS